MYYSERETLKDEDGKSVSQATQVNHLYPLSLVTEATVVEIKFKRKEEKNLLKHFESVCSFIDEEFLSPEPCNNN